MIPQLYFDKVVRYFDGDRKKAWTWFFTPHPRLSAAPIQLIKTGKQKKVIEFINTNGYLGYEQ